MSNQWRSKSKNPPGRADFCESLPEFLKGSVMRSIPHRADRRNSSRTAGHAERCPGCLDYPDRWGMIGLYVSKMTGEKFSYALCQKCAVAFQVNPRRIVRDVENYFGVGKRAEGGAT